MEGVDLYPHFYDGEDLRGGEVCEREVVSGGEGEDVASSCYWAGDEEGVCEVCAYLLVYTLRRVGQGGCTSGVGIRCVFSLHFFDGAVVVYEDECVFVLRVRIACCAFVAGAEIALFDNISAIVPRCLRKWKMGRYTSGS